MIAAAALGCPYDSPLDPLTLGGRGAGGNGGNGGGGGGGGPTGGVSVAGSWRNLLDFPTSIIDTRWSFTPAGACSRTVITTQLDVGRESTVVRTCTYALSGASIAIVFQGSSFVSTFTVAFDGSDLLFDGFRFRRFG